MASRRFPPPWSAEDIDAAFVVKDGSGQTALGGLLFGAGVRLITRGVRISDPPAFKG
jgi:hypothetical protein